MIDILKIEPSTIARDLKGKFVCIYGPVKVGKTTFATQNPDTLICAFEKGTNFISGALVQPVEKWADMKLILRQLEKKEAQEKYKCIAIDTVSEAYTLCEEYICSTNGVDRIGDLPYGQGYGLVEKEFEKVLRKITMLGYGMIIIDHATVKNEEVNNKNSKGKEEVVVIEKVSPSMPARAARVVNKMVDIIGYIKMEWQADGTAKRTLITRSTPNIMAGSRLRFLPSEIPFNYQTLVDEVNTAIDKEAEAGSHIVEHQVKKVEEKLDFNELRKEASVLWQELISKDEKNGKIIMQKTKDIFGKETRLSEITENQVDLFNLILLEMREMKNKA